MASYVVENKNEIEENSDKLKSKKTNFKGFNFKKVGGLKPLVMILILLIVAVVLYNFSGFGTSSTSSKQSTNKIGYVTSMQYIKEIEAKLNDVIGEIKGAGNVKVMLSIDSSPELKVAENTEEKTVTTSSGSTTTILTEPIIVDINGEDSPLILKETLPTINGVIVVSSGAGDVKVKLDILTAVSTALGISPNKIEVFIGK